MMITVTLIYLLVGGWFGGAVVARVADRPDYPYQNWVYFAWTSVAWPWLLGGAIYRGHQRRIAGR